MAARGEDLHIGFSFDAKGLDALWRDLKAAGLGAEKELMTELKAVAGIVRIEAASRIGAYSPRIASTVRVVSRAGSKAHVRISVVAGNAKAPHARPFEHHGREGTFRHPVFGNRGVWVEQEAHPYLGPALKSQAEHIPRRVEDAIERTLRKHNLT